MDNHQMELAHQMESEGYILACAPDTLVATLERVIHVSLKPYPPAEPRKFREFVDNALLISE